MRRVGLLVLLVLAAAPGQSIDTVLFLPDSFVGARYPETVLAPDGASRVFVAGRGGLPAIIALNPATGARTARVPVSEDIEQLVAGASGVAYALGSTRAFAFSTSGDSLLASGSITGGSGVGAWHGPSGALYAASPQYGRLLKLDGVTLSVLDSIPVPLTPVDIVSHAGRNKLYVGARQESLAVIDGAADSVLRLIPVPAGMTDLLLDGDRLYCASGGDSSVLVVDCAADSLIGIIELPDAPVGLAIDRVRQKLYCAGRFPHMVTVVDLAGGGIVTAVPVPMPQALALDTARARLYVGTQDTTLMVIDCAGDSVVAVLAVGADCPELALAQGTLIAPSRTRGAVSLVRDDSVAGRTQVSSAGPRAAVRAAGKLYVALELADELAVYALPGLELLRTIPVPSQPWALVWDEPRQKVYCACAGADRVLVVDARTDSLLALVPVGRVPRTLCLDPAGDKLYCGCFGSTELFVVDCNADTVLGTVVTGRATRRLVYSPTSRKVYVCCHDSREVVAVDCRSDSVLARFPTGGNPWLAVFDRQDDYIYTGTSWGGPVISCPGDTLVGSIGDVFYVKGGCYDGSTNRVYLGRSYSGDVLVIDGSARQVIDHITVPDCPAEMGLTATGRIYIGHAFNNRPTTDLSVVSGDTLEAVLRVRPSPVDLLVDDADARVYVLNWESSCITVVDDMAGAVEEAPSAEARPPNRGATVVRGLLRVGDGRLNAGCRAELRDVCGRRVVALVPGDNDVSRLAAGVYMATVRPGTGVRVVVAR